MFSFKKYHLRRSTRTTKPLRWHYQATETYPYPSYYNIYDDPTAPYLSKLPPELHLSIISHLDPTSSACYGLSSKKLYSVHHSKHRKVGLYESDRGPPLAVLLDGWKPRDQVLDWESQRYTSREKYKEVEDRRRRGWRGGYPPLSLEEYDEMSLRRGAQTSERERRRLRRKPRFERHNIWLFGRRR